MHTLTPTHPHLYTLSPLRLLHLHRTIGYSAAVLHRPPGDQIKGEHPVRHLPERIQYAGDRIHAAVSRGAGN